MKYIEADKLIAKIRELRSESCISESDEYYEYAKSEIIDIITSLQQEQPEQIEEYGPYARQYPKSKSKQEQPEVDLEKEIENHIKECLDVKFPTTDTELIKKDVAYTARKFYELGFNARKEE